MNVQGQIKEYMATQPELKRSDLQELHRIIQEVMPGCKLWFLDDKNSENKTVTNPNIGYGLQTMKYADGKTREFYQTGLSANTTGISVGYCIKFKTMKDIQFETRKEAIRDGFKAKK